MSPAADKVKAIFLTAREEASAADRGAYLDEACAGGYALRRRVEALLRADNQPDHLLDRPAAEHLSREPPRTAGPDGALGLSGESDPELQPLLRRRLLFLHGCGVWGYLLSLIGRVWIKTFHGADA